MKTIIKSLIFILPLTWFSACEIGEQVDPNSPSAVSVLNNPNEATLNNLVIGTLGSMRIDLQVYYDVVGIEGREFYRFSGSDPRFVSDLLGQGGAALDNNAFYTTRDYFGRYRTVKNANLLIEAANNSVQINDAQRDAYIGFASTIMAHELLMLINKQNENGIRIDVADPDNLGPFVSSAEALTAINDLLNNGFTSINSAGDAIDALPFHAGFLDGTTFVQFNRALAARVAVYRQDYSGALTILNNSFFDLTADLEDGVYYVFSESSGDRTNPIFLGRDATGDVRVARNEWVNEAEANDNRLNKVVARTADDPNTPDVEGPGPAQQAGLSSNWDVVKWVESRASSIPIIRNEELILIYAEANIQTNNLTEGENALNVIRNAANLNDYSGAVTQAALIDEMLNQRRYSLFFEGHRWVDMRRYNRLDQLPIDRAGDIVHTSIPTPFDETNVFEGN